MAEIKSKTAMTQKIKLLPTIACRIGARGSPQ